MASGCADNSSNDGHATYSDSENGFTIKYPDTREKFENEEEYYAYSCPPSITPLSDISSGS